MKKNFKMAALALGAMTAGVLASCTAESGYLNEPTSPEGAPFVNLVKGTEVNAYSNGLLVTPLTNAGDGSINNETWNKFNANDLTNITDEERDKVLAAIAEKVTGSRISEDVVFPWENYFLQDVISAQSTYGGAGSSGNPSASYKFEAWNTGADCSPYWPDKSGETANYEEVTNSAHLNNYYQKQESNGSQTRINETSLMMNMKYGTYEEMKGKQFRWFINCHENLHWYEYIVVQVDGSYYICFDFACGHKENDVDGNPGRGNTQNDWDYNDWILKITPAGPHEDVWTGEPQEQEETCPRCPHHKHDGEKCPDCDEGTVCNPEDPKDEPQVPGVTEIPDHVEVNLEVEEHQDYLASHLSIHVRAVTDVEVFIPVKDLYYVAADDMAIVEQHLDGYMIHGGPEVTSWLINGQVVTLTVEFEENGIRVTTDGINDKVIDYLKEEIGDGLTFEVWNYYNADVFGSTMKEAQQGLRNYLEENISTVKFLDNEPSLYVNAFYYDDIDGVKTEDKNPWDCVVEIVEEQAGDYNAPEEGWWFNAAPYNQLQKKKGEDQTQPAAPVY
ncbi:MAG: hypothetical protein J1E38_07145 [Paramuribaculum sp.]|nr:hypothetical protein [Paramuribaculum sp.]